MTQRVTGTHAGATRGQERLGVAVVDQTPLFREGLSIRVLREPGMRLVGATGQPNAAVLLRERLEMDVLVVDAMLDPSGHLTRLLTTSGSGLTVVALVREPYRTSEFLSTMLTAGAQGLVLHTSPPERIMEAIRRSRTEGRYLDPALVPLMRGNNHGPAARPRSTDRPLSNREYEVLQLIADGLSNQGIAEALVLSVETVRTHIKSLLRKMAARDRAHAVAKGFRGGLLGQPTEPAVPITGSTRLRVADGGVVPADGGVTEDGDAEDITKAVGARIPRVRDLRAAEQAS